MTRHGSCPRYVVASSVRRSIRRVPLVTPVPLCNQMQRGISDFACRWPRISAQIARKDLWIGDAEDHGERPTDQSWHSQLHKSP